jgi:hypothetical protein
MLSIPIAGFMIGFIPFCLLTQHAEHLCLFEQWFIPLYAGTVFSGVAGFSIYMHLYE